MNPSLEDKFSLRNLFHTAIVSHEGLGLISCACLIPSHLDLSDGGQGLILGCFDGTLKYLYVPNQKTSSDDVVNEKLSERDIFLYQIGEYKHTILSVFSICQKSLSLVSFSTTDSHIHIIIRSDFSSPDFIPIANISCHSPVNTLIMETLSFVKNKNQYKWNIRIYCGCQDRQIYVYSYLITIGNKNLNHIDQNCFEKIICEKFSESSICGHTAFVRSLALACLSNTLPQKKVLCSAGDDFVVKKWDLNQIFHDNKKIAQSCLTYEGHIDDIVCLDTYKHFLASGGKDHSIFIWDLDSASARSEKDKVKILFKIPTPSVVKTLKFSFDGKYIYAGGGDGLLRIYERGDSEREWSLIKFFKLHKKPIEFVLLLSSSEIITLSRDEEMSVAFWIKE